MSRRGGRGRGRGGRSRLPLLLPRGEDGDDEKGTKKRQNWETEKPVNYPVRPNVWKIYHPTEEEKDLTEKMRKLDEDIRQSGYFIPSASYDSQLKARLGGLYAIPGQRRDGQHRELFRELPHLSKSLFPKELIQGLRLKTNEDADFNPSKFLSGELLSLNLTVDDEVDYEEDQDLAELEDKPNNDDDEEGGDYGLMGNMDVEDGNDEDNMGVFRETDDAVM